MSFAHFLLYFVVFLCYRDVPAKGMFEMDFFIQPKKTEEPKRTVDFCFDSKELDDIVGAIDVTITDDLPDETEIDDDDE